MRKFFALEILVIVANTAYCQLWGNNKSRTEARDNRGVLPKNMSNHPKVLFDAIDIYNSEMIAFNATK